MAGRISAALNWWIDGVAGAVSAMLDRIEGRDKPLRVAPDGGDGWTVFDTEGMPAGRIAGKAGEAEPLPDALVNLIRGRRLDVELSANRVFRAALPPVPAESAEFLAAIVEHRVDRLAPWKRGDRITGFVSSTAEDGQLAVAVAATARIFVAPLLAAAETVGVRELAIAGHPAEPGDAIMSIRPPSGRMRALRLRRVTGAALTLIVVAILGAAAYLTVQAFTLDQEIPDLQQRLDDRMAVIRHAKGPETATAEADPIDARKQQAPVAVVVMEALSKILPDDTSLTEMRVEDGHVKISGVTRSLPQLVPQLVASPFFSDADFSDPTERLEDGSDRFSLDLAIRHGSTTNLP